MRRLLWPLVALILSSILSGQTGLKFLSYETGHVHPLEMTPDGNTLLAVNTLDARLEVFDLRLLPNNPMVHVGAIQVGLEPITVRAVSNTTAWVVNNISDSISVVDISTMKLVDTVQTPDEPSDVIFTGGKAWVSCSEPDLVAVYDLSAPQPWTPTLMPILGEDPRAMTVDPTGRYVYVAIHTSGNNTTILAGDKVGENVVQAGADVNFMRDVVSAGGPNPPPNQGTSFSPPDNNAATIVPPETGLIVRKNAAGNWMDDNNGNWTSFVTGGGFDRVVGWDLYDHDLAIIDTQATPAPTVSYAKHAMTTVMALAIQRGVNPTDPHRISLIGTEAKNEIRFEPNLKSQFVRAHAAFVDTANNVTAPVDLNPHIASYAAPLVPQWTRDMSIGDPRAIVWHSSGDYGYVAGMGSNNVIGINRSGGRILNVEVGEGPTGLVLKESISRLFVLNRFSNSITVLGGPTAEEVPFHDPSPIAVRRGRKHLFDTHKTSGLGQVACASCHVNMRDDALAWDLGEPPADLRTVHAPNPEGNIGGEMTTVGGTSYGPTHTYAGIHHPMKGPMTTQTLQDIIGHEPFHWRGDKKGIEEFNGAFKKLQGDDVFLSKAEMADLKEFLKTIWVPPNPHRLKDNSLDTAMDLTRWDLYHFYQEDPSLPPGAAALEPTRLQTGDAFAGAGLFLSLCARCHTPPVGIGPNMAWDDAVNRWLPVPVGGHDEAHSALTLVNDGVSAYAMKPAGLRHTHEKTGFSAARQMNTRGFGYIHDGSVDTVSRFVSEFRNQVAGYPAGVEQANADLSAFMLSFSASGMNFGSVTNPQVPPLGMQSQNSHAGVGRQWTLKSSTLSALDLQQITEIADSRNAAPNDIEIIVKQNLPSGGQRGYVYIGNDQYLDDAGTTITGAALIGSIQAGAEATITLVPAAARLRFGIDRDCDGFSDAEEVVRQTKPYDRYSRPDGIGITCNSTAPAAPTAVTSAAPSPYVVNVSWTPSGTVNGYLIERSQTNSPQWELVGQADAAATGFADTSVGEQTSYSYRVRSYNCAGRSVASTASASVTTLASSLTTLTCHVHAIDLQIDPTNGRRAYGTVNVVNDQGRAVAGVTVTVLIAGSSSSGSTSAVTNSEGQARFDTTTVPATPAPSWTFTVTGITGGGGLTVNYDSASNFVSTASIQ